MEETLICTKKLQICQEKSYSLGKQLSGKTKLPYLYGSERKKNGCPSKYDQQICRKRTTCDHRSNLKKKTAFFSRKLNFENLFWLWAENLQSFCKPFPQRCKNRTLCFQKKYLKQNFSERSYIFISFHCFAENILTWRKTPWSSRRHFTWPVEFFEEEFLGETKNSWVLRKERKFSVFWRNSFSRVVKTAFGVSRETLWEKWTFSRKKHDYESIFWHWVKNFLFWPKFSPGVSKLKCTCPKTVLNKFSEKNHFHLSLRNF